MQSEFIWSEHTIPSQLAQGHFPGTLFRLPLRTSATAAASDIKPAAFSPEDGWALLGALAQELPEAMLFLKSVRCACAAWPHGNAPASAFASL